jgi:hypothetical protein
VIAQESRATWRWLTIAFAIRGAAVFVILLTWHLAEKSSISQNTVKSDLARIFNKMGTSNRVELVEFAAHHRLLDVV